MVLPLLLGVLTLSASQAEAGFYLRPRAGATVPINGGDPSYTLGLTAGYQFSRYLATELSYARLIRTGSGVEGNLVQAEGVLAFPTTHVTPFLSGGVGFVHYEVPGSDDYHSLIPIGAGISLQQILFLNLAVGITYSIVPGGADFLQPYLGVGLSF